MGLPCGVPGCIGEVFMFWLNWAWLYMDIGMSSVLEPMLVSIPDAMLLDMLPLVPMLPILPPML